ncbi:hypothetical protein D3C74_487720 [compost metagenome]
MQFIFRFLYYEIVAVYTGSVNDAVKSAVADVNIMNHCGSRFTVGYIDRNILNAGILL